MREETLPWQSIQGPTALNGDLAQVLASVDSLQRAWADVIAQSSAEEFREARHRSLRRHAIETGIIERLYDVEWGVTEALVAEGLTADVAEREGGVDALALETIRAQFDALARVSEAAGSNQPLTVTFIRQLQTLLCRTQTTFTATDQFGRPVERPLRHGAWKELPNHAVTRTGQQVAFAPPEHVQAEIDRMLALEAESGHLHPLIRAAWLHYALVAIHPFDDGNGRVARALALLILLQAHYAPLVVDRYAREEYMASLEAANSGDLRSLLRLFARLEVVALRGELERPAMPAPAVARGAGAVDVARAYVERFRALRELDAAGRAAAVEDLAVRVNTRVKDLLEALGAGLADQFRALDPAATHNVWDAAPPDDRAHWWRAQIIRTARRGGFFANITAGTWWCYLRLTVLGQQLRYVVVTQKVGRGETGVIALTVFAESVSEGPADESAPALTPLLSAGEDDSVTLVHSDDLDARWLEIAEVVDRTLAAAVANYAEGMA